MQRSIYDIHNQDFRFPVPWWTYVVALLIAPFSLFVAAAWCLDVQRQHAEVSK